MAELNKVRNLLPAGSPNLQHGGYHWGNFSSAGSLPNVAADGLDVAIGDVASVGAALYKCNSPTSGSAVWAQMVDQTALPIAAGTYVPTLTAVANLDAAPTLVSAFYQRIGSVVHVQAEVSADPTAGSSTATSFRVSLPVASDFTGVDEASGIGAAVTSGAVAVASTAATNDVTASFASGGTSAEVVRLQFSYVIL